MLRGSRLTGQLLSFARTQSLVPKLHDVNELVRNMAELISISVGAHVRLSLQLHRERAFVVVDSAQMEMAILNLAVNARDAMPQGGELEISTTVQSLNSAGPASGQQPAEPSVTVAVRDSGAGIRQTCWARYSTPFSPPSPTAAEPVWA